MAILEGQPNPEEKLSVAKVRELLAPYLESNSYSKIEESEPGDSRPFIKRPWGDETLEINSSTDKNGLFEALNQVILPERFSALWHKDTKDFEIIYTTYPLIGSQKDVSTRKFSFTFRGKNYTCEFGKSSDRLLIIADCTVPIGISHTQHRNLSSFGNYVAAERGDEAAIKIPDSTPVSFWIRNFDWDEDLAVDLGMHLNFYMTYFDIHSPSINIFPPKLPPQKEKPRDRYIAGYFPLDINAEELNRNLLHYWGQSRDGDAFRKFLYAYQIVEYSSFYFVDEGVKRALRKALATPHLKGEIDNLVVEIMDSVAETKNWDGTKMSRLLRMCVDPRILWKEIEQNKEYFSTTRDFEGGFKLRTLISDKENEQTFCNNWEGNFTKDMRDIRNALSHGREQSMEGVITPTASNMALIRPWASLATLVAGQVMLYRDAAT